VFKITRWSVQKWIWSFFSHLVHYPHRVKVLGFRRSIGWPFYWGFIFKQDTFITKLYQIWGVTRWPENGALITDVHLKLLREVGFCCWEMITTVNDGFLIYTTINDFLNCHKWRHIYSQTPFGHKKVVIIDHWW